jgi:hypothetical protein
LAYRGAGCRDDNDLARLLAGGATSLVLLTVTAVGLASCPIAEPLEVSTVREQARAELFTVGRLPQMLLRIWWALRSCHACRAGRW